MDWVLPLLTLTLMEVVLGIDNIIFISILVGGLPEEKRRTARYLGLALALVARLGLLFGIRFIMELTTPLFHWSSIGWVPEGWVESHHVDSVTGKDLVLLAGGAFLIAKSVIEIHKKVEGDEEHEVAEKAKRASFGSVIFQIIILDVVFSLDSVISAIGMVKAVWIMVVAMLVAVAFMTVFAGSISRFIDKNPTFKMLALAFLVLIGVMLVADGLGQEISKGYIYAAIVFALGVEVLNMRARRKKKLVAAPG
ncbi:MAG: TerC family protein [Myxococcaceae bacterium]|nr:TerC family protein [Myxococcaceae bacterium]